MATAADHPAQPLRVGRWEAAVVAALLLLAGVVRMGWPGLTEFKADEGRMMTLALQSSAGDVSLHGLASSVGFPNAPMSVWLYALPLVVWRHPFAPTIFTGLLNTLALGGVYWLTRRYWGRGAALAALIVLTTGPWAIIFSRKIWAQNLLPLFAVGWGVGAALAFIEARRPFIALHLICLAVAAQIHPAAIGLAPATLLLLGVFRRRVNWRWFAAGIVLGALSAAPFLWYLWQRYTAGGLPFSTGQAAAAVSLDSVRLALEVAAGIGIEPLGGAAFKLPSLAVVARWLWLALVITGAVATAARVARRWADPASHAGFIVLAWLLAPALFFVWHRTPVYVHYFIAGLPAAGLLAGVAFAGLTRRLPARGRGVAWAALAITAAVQLFAWSSLVRFAAAHPLDSGFGIPLQTKLAAAMTARRLMAETGADEVLLVGDGTDPEVDDFPAEYRALLHDASIRYVDLNAEALFPAAPAVALIDTAQADELTTTRPLYADLEGSRESVAVAPGVGYTIQTLSPSGAPQPAVALDEPPLLANFVRLLGHGVPRFTPEGMVWDVYWRTADNPEAADYHIFNHLLDVGGTRVGQADAAAFAADQWRAGDRVLSRFLLPLTADATPPLTMRVGMYRYPSLENVPVLDEAANPAGDAVEIPVK